MWAFPITLTSREPKSRAGTISVPYKVRPNPNYVSSFTLLYLQSKLPNVKATRANSLYLHDGQISPKYFDFHPFSDKFLQYKKTTVSCLPR